MPNYDRTGPRGMGAMTGRGLGYCKKKTKPIMSMTGKYSPLNASEPKFNSAMKTFVGKKKK
jgi:hypothetical protein